MNRVVRSDITTCDGSIFHVSVNMVEHIIYSRMKLKHIHLATRVLIVDDYWCKDIVIFAQAKITHYIIAHQEHHRDLSAQICSYVVMSRETNCNKTSMRSFITVDMTLPRCSRSTPTKTTHIRVHSILTLSIICQNTAKIGYIPGAISHARSCFKPLG